MRARACNGGLTAAERKVMHNEIKRQRSRKLKEAGIDFEKWEAEKWDI